MSHDFEKHIKIESEHSKMIKIYNIAKLSRKEVVQILERCILLQSINVNEILLYKEVKLVDESKILFYRDYEYDSLENMKLVDLLNNTNDIYDIFIDICESLWILDGFNLYNGNVKPSNILCNEEKRIKVCDLFLRDLRKENSIKDILFDSPEMLESKECNIESDIWSFGCMIYYLSEKKVLFCEIKDKTELIKNQLLLEESNEINKCKYKLILKDMLKVNISERIHMKSLKEEVFVKNKEPKQLNKLQINLILNNPDVIYYIRNDLPMKTEILNYMLNNECIYTCYYIYIDIINDITNYYLSFHESKYLFFIIYLIWHKGSSEYINKVQNLVCSEFMNSFYDCNKSIEQKIFLSTCERFDIELCGQNLDNEGLIYLSDNLSIISEIKTLDLCNNNLSYEGLLIFSENMRYLSNLEILEISENELYDESIVAICKRIKELKNLKVLGLSEIRMSENGFKLLIEHLKELKLLEKLDVERNEIKDTGMDYLILNLCNVSNLSDLILNECNISEEMIIKLCDNLTILKNLKRLSLNNNNIKNKELLKNNINQIIKSDSKIIVRI